MVGDINEIISGPISVPQRVITGSSNGLTLNGSSATTLTTAGLLFIQHSDMHTTKIVRTYVYKLVSADLEMYVTKFDFLSRNQRVNQSPPGQKGRHPADDIFSYIPVNEKCFTLIQISPKSVPYGPTDDNLILAQTMAWRWIGDKPPSEPMLTRLIDAHM